MYYTYCYRQEIFSDTNYTIQVNQKSFNKKNFKSVGMTLAKIKEQDGMTLAKVKEQDGMTVAKVRHAQVSHAQWRNYGRAGGAVAPRF